MKISNTILAVFQLMNEISAKAANDFQKKIGVPHLATCIFLIFYNEPELGAEIDPGI